MSKTKLGPQTLLYPMPALLIGTLVDGQPNFMTAAWAGIVCGQPPMLGVAIHQQRYTMQGLRQTGTFSVNVPHEGQARETDYCGIVSGRQADKTRDCGFNLFYGALATAPLIEECPVNLECRVMQEILLGSHYLVIGTIEETHVSEDCLTGGYPDVAKIKPLGHTDGAHGAYFGFGPELGASFRIGLELKPE